jgi:hypothetical protein
MAFRLAVVIAALAAAACTSGGSAATSRSSSVAVPTPSGQQPSTSPAALPTGADPGYAIAARETGTGSRTVVLPTAVTGSIRLSYSCVGSGRIRVRLNGSGPESDCDGKPLAADLTVEQNAPSIEVSVSAGTRWNLLLQTKT